MIFIFKHLFYRNYVGLSFWPFIFLRDPELRRDTVLINHERIHLRQQAELLVLFFYLWYIGEWMLRTLLYLDPYRAYQNISFEREAYTREKDLKYLSQRKPYAFLDFLTRDG